MFILGVVCTLIFMSIVYGAYYLGTKKDTTKQTIAEVVKREEERLKQEQEEIDKLMSYNYKTALKEVTHA